MWAISFRPADAPNVTPKTYQFSIVSLEVTLVGLGSINKN